MQIKKIKTSSAQFDFKQFSAELKELSACHGVKLVSVGALSGLDADGAMYMAVWAAGDFPTNAE